MTSMERNFKFLFPVDGDVMVGEADGVKVDAGLKITVLVEAPFGSKITVNKVPAKRLPDGNLGAEIILDGCFNRLEAKDRDTGAVRVITVFVFEKAYRKYRFTVDDFIRGFQDIQEHRDTYGSIFENSYLKIFKEAHDRYGSKVHINVFYETEDRSFNLSMMTDRFYEEFTANASWLSFSFHARSESPDMPYLHKSCDRLKEDGLLVETELRRFAGEAVLRDSTTLHWGATDICGARVLRDLGYKALCGYFTFFHGEDPYGCYYNGDPMVSYYLTKEQVAHMEHRCFWVDTQEDILFARLHMVLNAQELAAHRVEGFLDELAARPSESGFIQMVIHEQHFYSDYIAFEPDYRERILTMARWMHQHGYHTASLSDLVGDKEINFMDP